MARALKWQIFEDETVVMVAHPGRLASLPKYVFSLGLYALWRKRDTSVLTDRRILLGRGLFRRDEESIPLASVEQVTFNRSGLRAYVDVTVAAKARESVRRIGPLSSRDARRFAREILRRT